MTVAIMQPYLFPYLGYFRLLRAADAFVYYGEAQYRRGGYVNRNRIEVNGAPTYFTLPVARGTLADAIDGRLVADDYPRWRRKFLRSLRLAYTRAPHVSRAVALAEGALPERAPAGASIGEIARDSIDVAWAYLYPAAGKRPGTGASRPKRLRSSELDYDRDGGPQAKVLSMCHALGGTDYVNAPGGRELYDGSAFARAGIRLRFVEPLPNPTLPPGFRPGLSILDAVARFDPQTLRDVLEQYRLSA